MHGRPSRITGCPRRAPCPSSWSNDFCAEVPDRRENSRPRGGHFGGPHGVNGRGCLAPSRFAEFAPVSSKISTASHGRVPAQADVSVLRADLADRLGDLCSGLNVRDAVSGLAFVRWSRDREDDWYTCDVALEVLPGELVGVGDAIVLESWPVACAQIGRDHLMLRNSRMPIEKNPWAVRVRSPSGGASDGVFYVFVGRHGIETVSGAKLLLNLSGLARCASSCLVLSINLVHCGNEFRNSVPCASG